MNRRIGSFALMIVMVISLLPISISAADKTLVAPYGTPVIDGVMEELWEKTNYNTVENCAVGGYDMYKGWFKVMWDENNIYVFAKVYGNSLSDSAEVYEQDALDVYMDENMARTKGYEEFDYQVRSNFKGKISGNNYDFDKASAKTQILDDSFIVEMAFPLKSGKKLAAGNKYGFEILMQSSQNIFNDLTRYTWNCQDGWVWNDTSCFGYLQLENSVSVESFVEPKYVPIKPSVAFNPVESVSLMSISDEKEVVNDVVTIFDSTTHSYPILLMDEYPSMEINNLATVIGGTVENGDTLVWKGSKIKFTEGERLAEYGNGHIILERKPLNYMGGLYVPVSSMLTPFLFRIHYDRFNKTLEIYSGTDYPDTELVLYARDFGAVGDGVHYDGAAITKAINAAVNSGKPSKVVLDEGKTYLLESRQSNYNFFLLEDVQNFILEGNGSTLLFDAPTNSFMDIRRSANVTVQNLYVDYKELPVSWGTIREIDYQKGTCVLEIPEHMPLPAADDWVKHFWNASHDPGWWFTQIMDPEVDRFKYGVDHFDIFIDSINKIEGRKYLLTVSSRDGIYKERFKQAEVGDRLVINTRYSSYDVGTSTHQGWVHGMIEITESGDVTIKNVDIYQSPFHYVNAGLNWGRINLIDCGMITKEGRLMSTNSDGIHIWRNRAGFTLDGCLLMNTLDDQTNFRTEAAWVTYKIDDYTFDVDLEQGARSGDELLFADPKTHSIIGRAYVKSYTKIANGRYRFVIDRPIEGLVASTNTGAKEGTMVANLNTNTPGTVIRNSKFMYSRRFALLIKSHNTLIENCYMFENGGSGLCANDEVLNSWEGAFPSSFTFRNNTIVAPDIIPPYYPLQVQAPNMAGYKSGETANVDGFLIENNVIDSGSIGTAMYISSVDGLYMLNNTLKSSVALKEGSSHMPITITNSRIEMIDGINFEFAEDVDSVITIAGCEVDEANIKNINIIGDNKAKPFDIK